MKKKTFFLLICLVFSLTFCSCSPKDNSTNAEKNTTEAQATQTNTDADSFESQILEQRSIAELVPDSVLFNTSNTVKLKYISNINTREIITNDTKSEDSMDKKQQKLDRFLQSITGKTGTPQPSDQGTTLFNYILDDGVMVSCSGIAINVTPKEHPLTSNSTDKEILDYLKNDKYLNALAKYSGVDLNNAIVFRETDPRATDNNKSECTYLYHICTKADNVIDQAYNLANKFIYFSLLEPTEKANYKNSFVGGYVWDNAVIKEAVITADDFRKAAEKSDAQVLDENKALIAEKADSADQYINCADKRCKIVYDITLADGFSLPVFRFFYQCADGSVIRNDVPCIDVSSLN